VSKAILIARTASQHLFSGVTAIQTSFSSSGMLKAAHEYDKACHASLVPQVKQGITTEHDH